MAWAKFELYPNGRSDLDDLCKPLEQSDKEVDQFGLLREAAHDYFCQRNGDMGKHPHVRKSMNLLALSSHGDSTVLALLVTSSRYRRRGAGSLLVQWGITKSEEISLPLYLQASEQGRRL